MFNINIRNAALQDLDSLRGLLSIREISWDIENYSDEYFKSIINDKERAVFLVAESGSKIVGIIFEEYSIKEDWAELGGVSVVEDYRNRGIGSLLINEFEKIIRAKNISFIHTEAHIDTLARFIHKLGYEKGQTYVSFRKRLV